MRRITRHTPTIIGICLFCAVNLVAFNWTSKFFREQSGTALLRYGDQMPKLEGSGYFGGERLIVGRTKPNLVVYLSAAGLKGQSISLLKFCETLRQKGQGQFQTTLITSGLVPEVLELLQDKLIGYTILNDSNEDLARRLGLESGESGTFYFDQLGLCKFSSRQQPDPEDLRQLLASQGIGANTDFARTVGAEFGRGKSLPSWSVVDALTLRRLTTTELSSKSEQSWLFFLADCFSCGPPSPEASLRLFADWRKSAKNINTNPVIVFDSAFLRRQVAVALNRFAIDSPAFVSDEDLRALSKFAASRGLPPTQPLIVRTDSAGAVINISTIRKPGDSDAALSAVASESSKNGNLAYRRTFQELGLDVYDVDSQNNLYYVSDRKRHSVIVFNERFEIQREIGGIGSAPGRLFRPGYIEVSDDGIIYVQDGGNERIQSFTLDGTHLGTFSTEPYMGFAAGTRGEIYLGQPEKGALISVHSREGKLLRSFGKLKDYSDFYGEAFRDRNEEFSNAINRVRLSVDRDGNILASFMLIPLIQKYTRDGELVFERRLEGPEIDALTQSPSGRLTMSMDGFVGEIIALEAIPLPNGEIGVVLTDRSIYVADQSGQRLRVLRPSVETNFTPEMTGVTPAGEVLLIGLSPRNCYRLSAS